MTHDQTTEPVAAADLPKRKRGTHWQEPPAHPSGAFLPQGPVQQRQEPRAAAHRTADFLTHTSTQRWVSVAEAFDSPSAVRPTRDVS
ncbi:hypothetical protein [Kitasatospora sp. MAP12-44]|uniref:hypothetical protein n=1 Tax=unclassified Kitasatospora TaxID=2633591 RepID=UPI002476CFD9|nr:hypothetical protein [Kitasatospora sp. MAP12-44]MDH6107955.1 hypothetical protein [Kitasatospora sp. MAP12-44]